jgi:hypothetical protein
LNANDCSNDFESRRVELGSQFGGGCSKDSNRESQGGKADRKGLETDVGAIADTVFEKEGGSEDIPHETQAPEDETGNESASVDGIGNIASRLSSHNRETQIVVVRQISGDFAKQDDTV